MLDDLDDIHPLFHGAPRRPSSRSCASGWCARCARRSRPMAWPARATAGWSACRAARTAIPCWPSCTELKWRGLLPVDLLACNLDQGQPGFPATVLPEFLTRMGVPHRIEYQDTYSVVVDKIKPGGTMCSLCSRLRRGNLYRIAREEGCSTVVLGHHRDDILETFFMNLFHGGRLASMPPRLLNEEGDLFVARPLAFVAEADCEKFRPRHGLSDHPLRPLRQPGGVAARPGQEAAGRLGTRTPGRRQVMFRALMNVRPSHLADPGLFDFAGLLPGQPGSTLFALLAPERRSGVLRQWKGLRPCPSPQRRSSG
jgi:tRNA 2-thiocytidine biosynthesis protein TtcA